MLVKLALNEYTLCIKDLVLRTKLHLISLLNEQGFNIYFVTLQGYVYSKYNIAYDFVKWFGIYIKH